MPIIENKMEYPAEKLAKTLQEFNFRNEQERLKQEERNKNQEKENKLFDALNAQQSKIRQTIQELSDSQHIREDEKFKSLVNHIVKLNKQNLEMIGQIEISRKRDMESFNKSIEMTLPGYFIDIESLKKFINDIKIDYKDLLGRPSLLKIQDIDKRITELKINYDQLFNKPVLLQEQDVVLLLQKFKVDYQDLINKPDILSQKDVNKLIIDYSRRIEDLFQIDLKMSNVKIEEINKKYREIKELTIKLNKEIDALKEESKKISPAPYPYSGSYSGYDYASVRMSKMIFITSDYPASSFDFGIMANAISNAITITLPSAIKTGQVLAIKKIDSSSNSVTIVPSGTETIDGAFSIVLSTQYESRWLVSGGNSIWYIVSSIIGTPIDNEVPSGLIDGSNAIFTLTKTPKPTSSLRLYLNGIRQKAGGEDFTLSGVTITFGSAPPTGSLLLADYTY